MNLLNTLYVLNEVLVVIDFTWILGEMKRKKGVYVRENCAATVVYESRFTEK